MKKQILLLSEELIQLQFIRLNYLSNFDIYTKEIL